VAALPVPPLNVMVFVALAPVIAGIVNVSLYVPASTLKVTGPDTPLDVSALTAAVNVA
jgi:hypothetical protein